MFVTAYGARYDCARAVKGTDYIRLYDAVGTLVASFDGISDFSGYTIEGGDWEAPPPTPQERIDALEAALLEMIMIQEG